MRHEVENNRRLAEREARKWAKVEVDYMVETDMYRVSFGDGTAVQVPADDPIMERARAYMYRPTFAFGHKVHRPIGYVAAPPKPQPNKKLLALLDEIARERPARVPVSEPEAWWVTPALVAAAVVTGAVPLSILIAGSMAAVQFSTGGSI